MEHCAGTQRLHWDKQGQVRAGVKQQHTFSYSLSSSLCIMTRHSPLLVSHTSVRLLMPEHLQTPPVSAGLTVPQSLPVSCLLMRPCMSCCCKSTAAQDMTSCIFFEVRLLHGSSTH